MDHCPKHDTGAGPCHCEEQPVEPRIPAPFWMFLLGVAALYLAAWIVGLLVIEWVMP